MLKSKYFLFLTAFCFLSTACSERMINTIRIGVLEGPTAVSAIQLINQPTFIGNKKIEIIVKSDPQQIQALMLRNKLDFVVLPTIMAANLYNKDVPYRMVACPVWGTLYVVTNTAARKLDQLNNEKVSVFAQSSTADVLLQRLIKRKDLQNVNINYTLNTNSEIANALLLRKIKFAVISEPLVSKLLAQDSSIHILSKLTCEEYIRGSDRSVFIQTAFMVSTRFINAYPSLVAPVCEAYANSCNFTSSQPSKTAMLMVQHGLATDTITARKSIPLCNIRYTSAFALGKEIKSYLRIFYNFNPQSIGGKIPDRGFIFTPTATTDSEMGDNR